jgi:hypothetical protein
VLPGQDRPHAPGPVVLPTCCAPGRLPTCCPWCCRPVLPTCCAAGQLPAGCPTLPARHSGSIAGPVVLPVKIGPTLPAGCRRATLPAGCRRAARGAAGPCCRRAALPVKIGPTLPAGCRCAAGQDRLPARGAADVLRSRPVAPRSRPVTREALPARGAAGQDRPHAPGRLPTCCRSRSVADMLPVVLPCPSTLLYAARLRRAGIAPYDRHMPRCHTFLTPSTGISPSDSVTPIYITLEEV